MSGQLTQCRNWHQAGKPGFEFWIPECLYGTEMHNSLFSLLFIFINVKTSQSVSYDQSDTGPLIWNNNNITALHSHNSIHN